VPCDPDSPAPGLDADVNDVINISLMAHFEDGGERGRPFRRARPGEASPEPPRGPDARDPPRASAGKKGRGKGRRVRREVQCFRQWEASHGVPSPSAAGRGPLD
jgi:hypothetical protein